MGTLPGVRPMACICELRSVKPQGMARPVRNWRLCALADSFQIQNSKKHCVGKTKQNLLLFPVLNLAALMYIKTEQKT